MITRSSFACLAVIAAAVLPLAAQTDLPMPALPSGYSAVVTVQAPNLPQAMKMRYVVDGGNTRVELNEGTPQPMIMITNTQKQASYMVMPAQRMYMVTPLDSSPIPAIARDLNTQEQIDKVQPKYLGTETVNGVACKKYSLTTDQGTVFLWISEADNHPVRIASADGDMQMDWTDMKVGAQPDSAFLPPAGYQMMKMPSMPGMPSGGPTSTPGNNPPYPLPGMPKIPQ